MFGRTLTLEPSEIFDHYHYAVINRAVKPLSLDMGRKRRSHT